MSTFTAISTYYQITITAGEGLMTVMTHNIRNFSQKNENLVKRLGHLHSCYETADGGLPDVIVIQEVKVSGDRDPVKQLADYFNGPKVKVPGKKFDSMVSQELGTGERAGVIYNSERLKLKKYKHGLPIARNIDANPDLQEANSFGYSSDELNDTSRFPEAVGGGERLFKRLPAYWLFECLETGSELIICSVHLVATDTEHELQRLKDLLSRNPQDLLDQNKLFVLAGDMNFEFSRDPSARTYAVDSTIDSQGQPNWRYLLDVTRGIPSKCTNVARYWNDEGKVSRIGF